MSPEDQRIAISQACGWREAFPKQGQPHPETKRGGILLPYEWVNESTHARAMHLPDYLNDLNAMHVAEKVLDNPDEYEDMLAEVCAGPEGAGGKAYLFHATAAQRAEAFLLTIGKWQDQPQEQHA